MAWFELHGDYRLSTLKGHDQRITTVHVTTDQAPVALEARGARRRGLLPMAIAPTLILWAPRSWPYPMNHPQERVYLQGRRTTHETTTRILICDAVTW